VGAPPPPSDVLEADPELTLAYATHRLNLGDRSGARTFLDLAQQRLSLAEDRIERLGLIADALRLTEAQLGGDVDTVQSYAPQVLARVPSPPNADRRGDESARAVAFAALGTARQNIGDIDAAEEALSHGLVAARHAGLTCQMWECTAHLALLHAMRGESHAAERAARAVLSAAACHQCQTTAAGHAYLTMTSVCWERDQLDDAGRYLDLAADCCGSGSDPLLRGALTIFRARLFDACGDPAQAEKVLAEGRRELTDRNSSHYLRCWMTATEADLITRRGDTDTARRLLAPLLEDPDAGSPLLTVTLARTFLADGDPAAALRLLHDWAGDETSGRSLSLRLEGGVLETMAASSAGDDRRAESLLEYVLGMAVRENARRVFVDAGPALRTLLLRHLDSGTAHWSMIMELLEATRAQPDPAPDPPPGEPLSSREATVLRYLQSTLTNSEIAAELSVSVHTVKTHLRNIYRKLGVPHRRAAVRSARARQLI
jgi:LuxR family maltose regulon positive regulatory protein